MTGKPAIREFASEEWRTYRELRLRALAESPGSFGATLAEEQDRQDTEWSARLDSGSSSRWDLPLLAEVDSEPVGLAWGRFPDPANPEVAYLYQMWVDPSVRRLGVGRMLLNTILAWATSTG